jgi:predicted secreted protein
MSRFARSLRVTLLLACLPATPLLAQGLPPPQGVLSLNASASAEVPNDTLSVILSARRDGPDAQAVQQALKQALDTALGEARKSARPGQVEVRTGNFSLYPRYAPKGGINGWQGTAELIIEGKDITTIAQLAGRLPTMTVQRLGWGLSKEAREKVEGEVAAQAVARFRSKAGELSRHFGYGGYTVREVNVAGNEMGPGPVPMMARAAMAQQEAADSALPVEPGKGTVMVNVSGSVQMTSK